MSGAMRPTAGLRFRVTTERWSGHGEGGTTCTVSLNHAYGDCYGATPEQIAQARFDVEWINRALAAHERYTEKSIGK